MLITLTVSSTEDNPLLDCEDSHMTSKQQALCKQYPELYSFLFFHANKQFKHHCQKQFQYERWDCTNIDPPFGATQPFLTLGKSETITHTNKTVTTISIQVSILKLGTEGYLILGQLSGKQN